MTDSEQKDQFLDILETNIGIIIKIARAYTNIMYPIPRAGFNQS
jgi:hypothetical protein